MLLLHRSDVFSLMAASTSLMFASEHHLAAFPKTERGEPQLLLSPPDYSTGWKLHATEIRSLTKKRLDWDPASAGPLVRLAFHDATTLEPGRGNHEATGGPNGSIRFELDRPENRALQRPLQVVSGFCEQTNASVALSDAIAVAGAAAIEHAGGPHIPLKMGRPTASEEDPIRLRRVLHGRTIRSRVESTMPSAGFDSDGLRLYFGRRLGLSEAEFVALSGLHGMGRHVSLLGMPKTCLRNLTRSCLEDAPVLLPFVASSADTVGNEYFKALLKWSRRQVRLGDVAFIPTDVALVVDAGLRKHVIHFADRPDDYFRTLVRAFQKLTESTATTRDRF